MYPLWAYRHRHTMLEEAIPVTKPETFEGLNHSHSREAIKASPIYTQLSYKGKANILFCCTACAWIYRHLMIALRWEISKDVDQRSYLIGLVIELCKDPIFWWFFSHFSVVTTHFVISTIIVYLVHFIPLTFVVLLLILLLLNY